LGAPPFLLPIAAIPLLFLWRIPAVVPLPHGALTVFGSSAKDGSASNVVEISLGFKWRQIGAHKQRGGYCVHA